MADFASTQLKLSQATADSLTITWSEIDGAEMYKVEMAKAGESPEKWTVLSDSHIGAAVKKKNLSPATGYKFRVSGRNQDNTFVSEYSESPVLRTKAGVHNCFRGMLGNSVTNAAGKTIDLNILGDGLIGLYFSASWCPPCRKFTPMLAKFYQEVKAAGKQFEIVFVSADRDKGSFDTYLKSHHPWWAIPFDAPNRQNTSAYFKVNGIPRLIIFAPGGNIVNGNAVGPPLTLNAFSQWQAQAGISL